MILWLNEMFFNIVMLVVKAICWLNEITKGAIGNMVNQVITKKIKPYVQKNNTMIAAACGGRTSELFRIYANCSIDSSTTEIRLNGETMLSLDYMVRPVQKQKIKIDDPFIGMPFYMVTDKDRVFLRADRYEGYYDAVMKDNSFFNDDIKLLLETQNNN